MRKFLIIVLMISPIIAVFGVAISQESTARDRAAEDRRLDGDLPAMLNYHPTDGASYEGQVRRNLDLAPGRR